MFKSRHFRVWETLAEFSDQARALVREKPKSSVRVGKWTWLGHVVTRNHSVLQEQRNGSPSVAGAREAVQEAEVTRGAGSVLWGSMGLEPREALALSVRAGQWES